MFLKHKQKIPEPTFQCEIWSLVKLITLLVFLLGAALSRADARERSKRRGQGLLIIPLPIAAVLILQDKWGLGLDFVLIISLC